jgi:hypothetical protein
MRAFAPALVARRVLRMNGKDTLPDRFTNGTFLVLRNVRFLLHNPVGTLTNKGGRP